KPTSKTMKAVLQRCHQASVSVDTKIVGEIGEGLVIFLGVMQGDNEDCARRLAEKIAKLRIFTDEAGKFHLSLLDVKGEALVISNFTLYGDARKGNRPNFMASAPPELANQLYESFVKLLGQQQITVASGVFGADMTVDVSNSGPVTLTLEMT
ncbi:MAG: D-aminoacyl-tRNA deacylase, partial [Abditibacteriaceae bacterium]